LCDELLFRIVQHRFKSVERVALNGLEELAAAVIRTSALKLVACSRQPSLRLQTEILRAGRPFLIALGDPRTALRNMLENSGEGFAAATRAVAGSCAAMLGIANDPNALVLRPAPASEIPAIAAAIAERFDIAVEPRELAAIADDIAGHSVSDEEDNRQWLEQLTERERAIINGALEPYVAYFRGRGMERLVWEPELFYASTDPAGPVPQPAIGPVDITGRPRAFIYGPYITLPPGSWSAEIFLGFSAETAGTSFFVEVCAGAQLASTHVQPNGEQVIETSLQFIIDEAASMPVEIRVFNERAAFDGRVVLGSIVLTPHGAVDSKVQRRLLDALRR
jgi:hypothetical protein